MQRTLRRLCARCHNASVTWTVGDFARMAAGETGESMAIRDAWIEKRLASAGANGTRNLSQMHLARQGVISEEMEYRRQARKARAGTGAQRGRARPRHHSRQCQSPLARAHGHRRRLQVQDQRQYRQFRGHLGSRSGAREAAPRRALRLGHGDGPLHRRRYSRDSQGHHRSLSRARRHRADLRSPLAREAHRRPQRRADARSDRGAGRAGRGLHDHPRRRDARVSAHGAQPHHRHRQPRRRADGAMDGRATRRKISSTSASTTFAKFSRSTTSASPSATACAPAPSPTPAMPRSSAS